MSDFASWLLGLIKSLFGAVWDFLVDVFVELADLVLTAVLAIISSLPAPTFTGGFGSALAAISSGVWFFASHLRLGDCLAVLGAGFAFRLARKAVTLFQW